MANINLLPWREQQRRERNQVTLVMCCAMWFAAALLVFVFKSVMDSRIEYQQSRNGYIQSEINALSKVIKEIEDLKKKRDELLARMEVIQRLQSNRSQIVHVFDDLVKKIPKGVYYDGITKGAASLQIKGNAQSNGRVSALMRNLDSSDWFDNASLKVVDVIDTNGVKVSKFDLEVSEQRKKDELSGDVESIN